MNEPIDVGNRSCPDCNYYHHPDDEHRSSPRPEHKPEDTSIDARINRALRNWDRGECECCDTPKCTNPIQE